MHKLNRKPNPELSENAENAVAFYRNAIAQIENFLTLKDHPGWQGFMSDVAGQLEAVEAKLDNFEKMTDIERAVNLKERKDMRWIHHAMERAEARLPAVVTSLAAAEAVVAERRKRDGTG